jgi:hypothetical protein
MVSDIADFAETGQLALSADRKSFASSSISTGRISFR